MVSRYLLPSVVDISWAAIKRTTVINQKKIKTLKVKQTIEIFINANKFFTFCGGYL